MPTVNEIRQTFLEFFRRHGHEIVPSSPLVPHNDPTLLFTNAGMVQFKNVFTGVEHRPYKRAVTAQKCVRAGGKHNDLDNVGYTARHHTFFEMLGNFSFGDYFKDVAIELAWKLVTKEFGLPPERLMTTVYAEDDEAFELWKKIAGLPESKIVRIPTSDNFWSMGDTGPCGPCSEIFYDHGPEVPGGPPGSPEADGDRFIEIWNLVFMQFEQIDKNTRVPLPKPSIDTGMGLERVAAVLQGKHDNYEIDLFQRIIAKSVELTGTPFEGGKRPSHKVIADHLRAAAFLIADGVMPSNEGRGYVLRRIMRRGMRHAHLLGVEEPLLWRLVPTLVAEMGQAYPELARAEALIREVLKLEETNFRRTLERGLHLLEEETAKLPPGAPLPGEVAFKLYDTYGFPLDLTEDALRAQGRKVDRAGFETAMARQKAAARAAWKGSGEAAIAPVWFEIREETGGTDFLGYVTTRALGRCVALVKDGARVDRAEAGEEIWLVANQTPFYGEAGGQVGDTGIIRTAAALLEVADTKKVLGDLVIHRCRVDSGTIRVGDDLDLRVDEARRAKLRRAHSATHLLHAALRRHLGPHVAQKGSLVAPDRLRFDFSHPKPVSEEELAIVEREVNHFVRQNDAVSVRLMAREEAIASGAIALFGEKYGEEVRVVAMGREEDGRLYSVELCGGTHVERTGDIGFVKLVSEGAVAAGIRRVEAVTGEAAFDLVQSEHRVLEELAQLLKAGIPDLPARIAGLLEERRKLERELAETRRKLLTGAGVRGDGIRLVGDLKLAARIVEGVPPKELRGTADALKKEIGSGVVALVGVNEGKAAVVVSVTPDLVGRLDAVRLVRAGVEAVGGHGGGGRPDFAQGGGPDASKAAEALAAIERALAHA
ncbi:MAG: alanine--tRNA ligase [Geminicoccaceae bacterium]|nr:alanine--tRNA ligase [Geminicoccaceae bacterium]MDW8342810.1 alanine--tRNA ligase [Geminicoccaceae bacterium]